MNVEENNNLVDEVVIVPEFESYRAEFAKYEQEKDLLVKEKKTLLSEIRKRDRQINDLKNTLEIEKSFRRQAEELNLQNSTLNSFQKQTVNKEEKFISEFKADFDKLIPKFTRS